MLVTRVIMVGVAVVGFLLMGCEAELPPMSPGEPAVLEPGYVLLPSLSAWRAVSAPGCDSIEPRMSWSPAIEILSSGGFVGGGTGNVQVYEDGTVLFDGIGCPNDRWRRGKMSRARVREIIDKLEQARFFMWPCDDDEDVACSDSFTTSLTIQRGRTLNTVVDAGCNSTPTLPAQAIELVRQAVGKNACSPSCGEPDAPAFCR